jgi:hypothetical protein
MAGNDPFFVFGDILITILSFMVTIAVMASGVTSASFAATRVGGDYLTGLFGSRTRP